MSIPASFSQVRRIIEYAMKNAYKLEEGQEPNGEQYETGMNRLNDLANFLQTQGLRLWTQLDVPITLTAGIQLYPLPGTGSGKPLRIPRNLSYTLNANGQVKTPVLTLSQQEWVLLSQNAQQGPISQIYVDKQLGVLNVYTYLIPDATEASSKTLHVVIQNQMVLYQNLTDSVQFPQEWYVGLQWLLAKELATGQPQEIIARCDAMAEYYRKELNNWDVEEDQTFFTPDTRMTNYAANSFT